MLMERSCVNSKKTVSITIVYSFHPHLHFLSLLWNRISQHRLCLCLFLLFLCFWQPFLCPAQHKERRRRRRHSPCPATPAQKSEIPTGYKTPFSCRRLRRMCFVLCYWIQQNDSVFKKMMLSWQACGRINVCLLQVGFFPPRGMESI